MGTVVLYPSSTLLALQWLRSSSLAGSSVLAAKIPTPIPPGALVVLRRAGGLPDAAHRNRARVDAQCWHDDEAQAETLAELVQALLLGARGQTLNGVTIGATSVFLGPTYIPDPVSSAARYLLTVEWQVPGVQI